MSQDFGVSEDYGTCLVCRVVWKRALLAKLDDPRVLELCAENKLEPLACTDRQKCRQWRAKHALVNRVKLETADRAAKLLGHGSK